MELEHVSDLPARSVWVGLEEDMSVAYGQTLKIEVAPGGTESLDAGPESGKAWVVRSIIVNIDEIDA